MTYRGGARVKRTSKSWEGSIVKSKISRPCMECSHSLDFGISSRCIPSSSEGSLRKERDDVVPSLSSPPFPYIPPTKSYTEPANGNRTLCRPFHLICIHECSRPCRMRRQRALEGCCEDEATETSLCLASSMAYCICEEVNIMRLKWRLSCGGNNK